MKKLVTLSIFVFTILFSYSIIAQQIRTLRSNHRINFPEKIKKPMVFPLPFDGITGTFGKIIRVPAEAPTIQQGIDQAQDGDTVLVAEGHYFENIYFRGKEITLASEFIMDGDTSHISRTIIDGSQPENPDSGSVVYFINGETIRSVLSGFSITGGSGTISRGFFWYDNTLAEYSGGGIAIWASGARIEYNRIINNVIDRPLANQDCGFGAGIEMMGLSNTDSVIIRNNIINNNIINAWFAGSAAVCFLAEYILFENNIVEDNVTNSTGFTGFATISVFWSGDITIASNLIKGNRCYTGDGRFGGGGIYIQGCSPKIYNNLIMENSTNGWGGGISLDEHNYKILKAVLINNTIINNSAADGGGIWIKAPGSVDEIPILFNNVVWGNTATISPGMHIDGPIHLYNSLIQDAAHCNINNGVFCTDPLFTDAQYYLCEQSPCLGSGVSNLNIDGNLYQAPSIDLDGNPRPSDADQLIDLGVYESDHTSLAFPLSFTLSHSCIYPTTGTMHFTSEISNPHQQNIQVFSKIYHSDSISEDSVEMFDDGLHGDGLAENGLYAADYQTNLEGIFTTGLAVQNDDKNTRFEYGDNQKFTTIGPLIYKGYTIVTQGDEDINPGETHRIKLELQNLGQTVTASNIQASITPLDTFVTLVNNGFNFNDIPAGQTSLSTNYRTLKFSKYITGPIDTIRLAVDITSDGYTFWHDTTSVIVVGIKSEQPAIPVAYSLEQNYPNPFNPTTKINYQLAVSSPVILKVYDVLGREIATLVNEYKPAGKYEVEFSAKDLPSGFYFYQVKAGDFIAVKKMILLK